MKWPPGVRGADLRGLGRLGVEVVQQVASLAEATHGGIQRVSTLRAPRAGAGPDPIARLAYAAVRGVSGLVGWGLDLGTRRFATPQEPSAPEPRRDALLAALNGAFGDHLVRSGNPLAIPMRVWFRSRPLPLEDAPALSAALSDVGPRVAVLLHGLCMSPWHWSRPQPGGAGGPGAVSPEPEADVGAAEVPTLLASLGYDVMLLQYNSGRRIHENGAALAEVLRAMDAALSPPARQWALVGHSMGGLVARSACIAGVAADHRWVRRPIKLIGLGTPHQGAPLERAGHGVETLLASLPLVSPFARLGRARSAGILDLRFGSISADAGPLPPLPSSVKLYAVAGTLSKSTGLARLRGDGLVPVASALGRHREADRNLKIPERRRAVIASVGHIDLLVHADVLRTLRGWLDDQPDGAPSAGVE